jgi:hypothetical protein
MRGPEGDAALRLPALCDTPAVPPPHTHTPIPAALHTHTTHTPPPARRSSRAARSTGWRRCSATSTSGWRRRTAPSYARRARGCAAAHAQRAGLLCCAMVAVVGERVETGFGGLRAWLTVERSSWHPGHARAACENHACRGQHPTPSHHSHPSPHHPRTTLATPPHQPRTTLATPPITLAPLTPLPPPPSPSHHSRHSPHPHHPPPHKHTPLLLPQDWVTLMDAGSGEWKESVQLVFEYFCERTPRSFVEQRGTSLVWNYKYAGERAAVLLHRQGDRTAVPPGRARCWGPRSTRRSGGLAAGCR